MTHIGAISAVATAEGPASPMMQHAPMNTVIAVASAALGSFYMQLLSIIVILGFYYFAFTAFFDRGASWYLHDVCARVVFRLRYWFGDLCVKALGPDVVMLVQTVFSTLNMVASGKMFVANSLPGSVLIMFTWNPLFHVIDQARGFAFINYQPRNSDPLYPLYFFFRLAYDWLHWRILYPTKGVFELAGKDLTLFLPFNFVRKSQLNHNFI